MSTFRKQRHGFANPVFLQEERSLLVAVDKAVATGVGPESIGRNGERPLLEFLERYLPRQFRIATGHFVAPSGHVSPQVDALVLDARYPLLSVNHDGSVLAMLHSVLATIEVKTSLRARDIERLHAHWRGVSRVVGKVFRDPRGWGSPIGLTVAYRARIGLAVIREHFFRGAARHVTPPDLQVLRLKPQDQHGDEAVGAFLWLEAGRLPSVAKTRAPLADLYYRLVQDCCYTLGARDRGMDGVGRALCDYMKWGVFQFE